MSAAVVSDMQSPPPELWTYSDFESLIPNTSPRNLVRLADRKKFPPFIRMTPRGEPMWAKAAILRYVERVYRPLIDSLSADNELTELGQEG